MSRTTGLLVMGSISALLLAACARSTPADQQLTCAQAAAVEFSQEKQFEEHLEVEVRFQSGCEELAGTLFLPTGRDPSTTLVFVHGAGSTPRLHYRQDFLAPLVEAGMIVFSYDKRGVGSSEGECCPGDRGEFDVPAADVLAAINAVRWHPDVRQTQLGLIGVSQAGWIIPIVATRSPDVSFVVLLSGPAVSVGRSDHYDDLTDQGIPADQALQRISEVDREYFDPNPFLEQMQTPALWLYGELDEDQPTAASVEVLEQVRQAHGQDFTTLVFPGVGHDLTHEPKLVPTVVEWIAKTR